MQELNQQSSIKYGDIFLLGDKHKVACGRSDDAELVKKLIGDSKVRTVITDPPYGVAYVENKAHFKETIKANLSNTTVIEGDQLQTEEEYVEFTKKWIDIIKIYLEPKNAFYVFNSDKMVCALIKGMRDAGLYYSQLIIWLKNTSILGRKDYNPQHELIAYGWFGTHKFERGKDKSVIFCPKPVRSKLHPTMKPIPLLRKVILNSTKAKDIIYDGFLGSGSLIIAAEQTGRICYGVELDPFYCETTIKRYESFTGQQAVKIGGA